MSGEWGLVLVIGGVRFRKWFHDHEQWHAATSLTISVRIRSAATDSLLIADS